MAEESAQGLGNQTPGCTKRPRSDVWDHFTRFTADDGEERARCNRCRTEFAAKHGPRNLGFHLRTYHLGGSSRREPAREQAEAEASTRLAQMIALRGHDPLLVEDDCFRSFVRRLNPEFQMPSRAAIEEMCDGIFDEARRDMHSRLRRAPGRVSLAVGKAKTTIEAGEVTQHHYFACHFVDDEWKLHKFVLDALVDPDRYPFDKSRILGVNLCWDLVDEVINVISDHGIKDRLSMVSYETTLPCIRTLLHAMDRGNTTNLVSRKIISTTYMDNVLLTIARCLRLDMDFSADTFGDEENFRFSRQKRQQLLSDLSLDLPWAYDDEDWYSAYCYLQILHKEDPGMETAFTKLLCKLWGKIYHALQRLSESSCPTSNICLKELFKLREVLQSELESAGGDLADVYNECGAFEDGDNVEDVLRRARDILDRNIKDSYLIWSVPLVLDPRYKLRYIDFIFKRAFNSEATATYMAQVTSKIKDLYADCVSGRGSDVTIVTPVYRSRLEQDWADYCRSEDTIPEVSRTEAETDLHRYLHDPLAPMTQGFDILDWWKVHGSARYPTVARMARDALAMPTCSKLSSDQVAQVRSILRGYSKKPYGLNTIPSPSSSCP